MGDATVGLDNRHPHVDRLYAIPVEANGRTVMLINTPRCWCGKRMVGCESAFRTSNPWPDINWMCEEHGNEGLVFVYASNDNFVTVTALAPPDPNGEETP